MTPVYVMDSSHHVFSITGSLLTFWGLCGVSSVMHWVEGEPPFFPIYACHPVMPACDSWVRVAGLLISRKHCSRM